MGRSFDEVYGRYGGPIYAYLARLTGDRALAEELAQEAFLRYLAHERRLAGANGSLGPWLFKVATNLGIDALRRRRGGALVGEPPAHPTAPSSDLRDLDRRVRDEVLRLDPELRSAFLLRAHHELPYREVAAALGVSERAAKDRFRRARETLARRLGSLLEDER